MKTAKVTIAIERLIFNDPEAQDYFRLCIFNDDKDEQIVAAVELTDDEFSDISNSLDLSVSNISVEN